MAVKIDSVVMLSGEDAGIHNLIARIRNYHIKRDFQRRDAVIIKNLSNGSRIIRYVMGEPQAMELEKGSMAIDYDGLITLGLKYSVDPQDCNLVVKKAGLFEKYLFFMNHPDLGIQLSIRLGVLGAMLGLLGLILGISSLF